MKDAPLKAKDAPDLGRFDWEDPFRMEDQLTEEERMLRLFRQCSAPAREALFSVAGLLAQP